MTIELFSESDLLTPIVKKLVQADTNFSVPVTAAGNFYLKVSDPLPTNLEDDGIYELRPTFSAAQVPTYSLVANAASYKEGASAEFTLTTTGLPNGTVLPYALSGTIGAADVRAGLLSGQVIVNNNKATIKVALMPDLLTEGQETLTVSITGTTSAASTNVIDTSIAAQRVHFSSHKLALDLSPNENAGQALEFIGLMAPGLIKSPAIVGLIIGIFDQGNSLKDVCQLAIDVGLVNSIAGSNTNDALAAMAFRNLLGFEADASTVNALVGYMDGRSASYSQAEFMTAIAELEINHAHIGLVGLQQTGIEYV